MIDEILPPGRSRETTIRRDAHGQWWHDGEPVTNSAVSEAFDRWIGLAPDGRFMVENDVNWAYVAIEGPPIFVRSVTEVEGSLHLGLSDGRQEKLQEATLRQDASGRLYCDVRGGTMVAGFSRAAMFALEPWVVDDGLVVAGRSIKPFETKSPLSLCPTPAP